VDGCRGGEMERGKTQDGMREGDEERTKKWIRNLWMDTNVGLKRFVHLSLSTRLYTLSLCITLNGR